MFPDLQSVLRLDQNQFGSGGSTRINVVEEEDQLGQVVLHHFVSLAIGSQMKVVIVGIENTFGHYNGAGMKTGHNLRKLKESGRVEFIDGLFLLSSKNRNNNVLKDIMEEIEARTIANDSGAGTLVILDKLSLLFSLGSSLNEVMTFTRSLQLRLEERNVSLVTLVRGSITAFQDNKAHNEAPDEMAYRLAAYLMHTSHLNILMKPLTTGRSANVSGNLYLSWTNDRDLRPQHYHFRVEDKDVKVFAPGTSSAVL